MNRRPFPIRPTSTSLFLRLSRSHPQPPPQPTIIRLPPAAPPSPAHPARHHDRPPGIPEADAPTTASTHGPPSSASAAPKDTAPAADSAPACSRHSGSPCNTNAVRCVARRVTMTRCRWQSNPAFARIRTNRRLQCRRFRGDRRVPATLVSHGQIQTVAEPVPVFSTLQRAADRPA